MFPVMTPETLDRREAEMARRWERGRKMGRGGRNKKLRGERGEMYQRKWFR